jgi:hypothetical protein
MMELWPNPIDSGRSSYHRPWANISMRITHIRIACVSNGVPLALFLRVHLNLYLNPQRILIELLGLIL